VQWLQSGGSGGWMLGMKKLMGRSVLERFRGPKFRWAEVKEKIKEKEKENDGLPCVVGPKW
jgi:hypothetical protein